MAPTWIFRTHQVHISKVGSKSDGHGFLGFRVDSEGVILIDFLENQRTVAGVYYVEVLRKLKDALIKTRKGKLHGGVLFHHDNEPAHSSRVVQNALREFRWEVLPHPSYSPDLAPSDFPKLKEIFKGTHFNDI